MSTKRLNEINKELKVYINESSLYQINVVINYLKCSKKNLMLNLI